MTRGGEYLVCLWLLQTSVFVFLLVVLSPVLTLSHDRQCTRQPRQPSVYVGASYSSCLDMSYTSIVTFTVFR